MEEEEVQVEKKEFNLRMVEASHPAEEEEILEVVHLEEKEEEDLVVKGHLQEEVEKDQVEMGHHPKEEKAVAVEMFHLEGKEEEMGSQEEVEGLKGVEMEVDQMV